MSQTSAIEACAIIVESSCTIYYLVLAILIDIGNDKAVGTFVVEALASCLRGMHPTSGEVGAIPIDGSNRSRIVIASTPHDRRMLTVEVGCSGKVTVGTSTIVVAPIFYSLVWQRMLDSLEFTTRCTIKNCKIFRSASKHMALSLIRHIVCIIPNLSRTGSRL